MRDKEAGTFKGARLDRALGSLEWLDTFPDTSVTHMPMINSDHSPIMVTTRRGETKPTSRFHFQAARSTHERFEEVVSDVWNDNASVMVNTKNMDVVLSDWNRTTFGNIHAKKMKLIARIGRI